jgi:succinoglycan biosynthesis protein ExoV
MKLYYYQSDEVKNFGDDLNEWLWQRLLPDFFDQDDETLFVGIGTLLNDYLPSEGKKIVFGSGVGYGNGIPLVKNPDDWNFYCVRGPLSALKLGLPQETAVTDAAMLLKNVYQAPLSKKRYQFSYMPHAYFSWKAGNSWRKICKSLGFGFIDARDSIETVLAAMGETEVLLTEAMHGAIIADTLRIPWIPIRSASIISSFKWLDWCMSLGIDYQPYQVTLPWDPDHLAKIPVNRMRRILARHELQYAARHGTPQLSHDAIFQQKTDALQSRLLQLKQDYASLQDRSWNQRKAMEPEKHLTLL